MPRIGEAGMQVFPPAEDTGTESTESTMHKGEGWGCSQKGGQSELLPE